MLFRCWLLTTANIVSVSDDLQFDTCRVKKVDNLTRASRAACINGKDLSATQVCSCRCTCCTGGLPHHTDRIERTSVGAGDVHAARPANVSLLLQAREQVDIV